MRLELTQRNSSRSWTLPLTTFCAVGFCLLLLPMTAAARPKTTINVWGWTDVVWKEQIAQFERQNPDITVKLTAVGELVSGDEKFLSAIAAGIGPDVILQNRHHLKGMAARGYYRDMNPLMKLDRGFEQQFLKRQLDNCKWLGHQYAIPLATDTRFLMWNKDMFRRAGIDGETPPKTWKDLENYGRKFNRRDDKGNFIEAGFVPHVGNSWLWIYGWLNGGTFVTRDEKTVTPTDPKIVEALTWCVKYYDNILMTGSRMPSFPDFFSKKLAMAIDGSWGLNWYSSVRGLDFGIANPPYPEGGQPATWSCGFALCIPASIKANKVDASWRFIKFMSGPEGWVAKAEFDYLSTKKKFAKNPSEMNFIPADVICNIPAMRAIEERFKDRLTPLSAARMRFAFNLLDIAYDCGNMSLAGQSYWNELDKAYWAAVNHKNTPERALEQCRSIVQQDLDKMWKRVKITK